MDARSLNCVLLLYQSTYKILLTSLSLVVRYQLCTKPTRPFADWFKPEEVLCLLYCIDYLLHLTLRKQRMDAGSEEPLCCAACGGLLEIDADF